MNEELKRALDKRMIGEEDEERRRDIQILREVVEQFSDAVVKLDDHISDSKELREALKPLGSNPQETILFLSRLPDILGDESDVKKRTLLLDKMIAKQDRWINIADVFLGKFASALATELGKNTPRTLVAWFVLYTIGLEKSYEGWIQLKNTILERLN